jgi:glyoxylase-like metal-dependent hydrolase (beta-lactamase superfamily II)
MYELDFLPVEAEDGNGTKSGDAITGRFWLADGTSRVIVVDAGYSAIGENVVDHVQTYYDTDRIDLLVSTHPDADHLNGLVFVLENLSVGELLIHRPREHFVSGDAELFSNIERVDAVIALAESQGVTVTEPFRGLTRWGGQFRVLGLNRPGTGGDCDLTRRMQIWVHQGSSMPRRVSALFGCIGTV